MQFDIDNYRYWGCNYYYGWDGNRDINNAINIFSQLRNNNDAFGSFMLGKIQYEQRRYNEAYMYMLEAYERGYSYAAYMIAIMCDNGLGIAKDGNVALVWYMTAAEQGVEAACDYIAKRYEKIMDIKKDRERTVCAVVDADSYVDGEEIWVASEIKLTPPNGYQIGLSVNQFVNSVRVSDEDETIKYFLRNIYSQELLKREISVKVKKDVLPPALDIESVEFITIGKKVMENGVLMSENPVTFSAKIYEEESGLDVDKLNVKVNGKSVNAKVSGNKNDGYELSFEITESGKLCEYVITMQDKVGNEKIVSSDTRSLPNVMIIAAKPKLNIFDGKKKINSNYNTEDPIDLKVQIATNGEMLKIKELNVSINGTKEIIDFKEDDKNIISVKKLVEPGKYSIEVHVLDSFDRITEEKYDIEVKKERVSQFYFLEDKNKLFYDYIVEAENGIKTNYNIGNSIRNALEALIKSLYNNYKSEGKIDFAKYAQYEYDRTKNNEFPVVKKEGELASMIGCLSYYKLLPSVGKVDFTYKIIGKDKNTGSNQKKVIRDIDSAYTFLRLFGNNADHVETKWYFPIKSYENALFALKLIHKIAISYVFGKGDEANKVPGFDEHKLPIDKYRVLSFKKLNDEIAEVTGCNYEYICFERLSTTKKRYYLVREYSKSRDKNDILRNIMVYDESYEDRMHMEAMADMSSLISYNSNYAEYYYVINEMGSNKPIDMTKKALSNMSLIERLEACRSIAKTIDTLHTLENPIYIRMLSYEDIKLIREKQGMSAKLVNYEFAKITGQDTIIAKIDEANKINYMSSVNKYKANELSLNIESKPADYWEKIDLYSLGILMRDIISVQVGEPTIALLKEFDEFGLSPQTKDVLEKLGGEPGSRPSARQVTEVIIKEIEYLKEKGV